MNVRPFSLAALAKPVQFRRFLENASRSRAAHGGKEAKGINEKIGIIFILMISIFYASPVLIHIFVYVGRYISYKV